MQENKCSPSAARVLTTLLGAAAAGYAAFAGYNWLRYGKARKPLPDETDDILDAFMPAYDVVERHHIHVDAPAEMTLAAAEEQEFNSPGIRAIFWLRALMMGAKADERELPPGFVKRAEAIGWRVLARVPGREIVLGAITKPWESSPRFESVPAAEFASFCEPDYVKVVLTLRADPVGTERSIFRSETRAVATDAQSWKKFRRYWACVAPGVDLIRRLMLTPVKKDAEQRAQASHEPLAVG